MLNALRPTIYSNPGSRPCRGVMIFITSIAFNTLSDAIRDAMDIKTAIGRPGAAKGQRR